jgi:hypothetical protein
MKDYSEENKRKSSGISRAASQAMLAAALATGAMAAPTIAKADTAITQTAEQRVNPYLGQTIEFGANVLDKGLLYGVYDQVLSKRSMFDGVSFEEYLEYYEDKNVYISQYNSYSDSVDMSVYDTTEPPVDPPTLNQKGLPNAMRMYGKKSGATQEAGMLLNGLNFSDVSFDTSGRQNSIMGQDSYGSKLEGRYGISNGSQGIGIKGYATDEHHELPLPESDVDLFAAGAEVVAIPVTYTSENGKVKIAPYAVAGVEAAEQKMKLMGLRDKDRSTEFSYGAGVAGLFTFGGLKIGPAVEFRRYQNSDGLFGDVDAVYAGVSAEQAITETIGIESRVLFRQLNGDYDEDALEYEAGPYVDAGAFRFSAGVRGDCVDSDVYDYDSTRAYGRIRAGAGRFSGFITADSDGDEHRGELGVTVRF